MLFPTSSLNLQGKHQDAFLSQCSVIVRRHHDHYNSSKGKRLIGVSYSFRGLVHGHHGRKYGSIQAADMVPEKELRVLSLGPQEAGRERKPLGLLGF